MFYQLHSILEGDKCTGGKYIREVEIYLAREDRFERCEKIKHTGFIIIRGAPGEEVQILRSRNMAVCSGNKRESLAED